jgi:multiple sugar transport system permease protein
MEKERQQKLLHFKRRLLGQQLSDGLLYKIIMYFLLIVIGFVFVYPLLYMFSISMMSNIDLVDSSIKWIPSSFNLDNYRFTIKALRLPKSLFTTILIAGVSTTVMAFSSALIGYGLARFNFSGKKLVFILMIFAYIMPKTLFFIPTYQIYTTLKLKGTLLSILLPAFAGQGLQASFFILIFYQFFSMIPKSLEEAAIIDGAKPLKIFIKIALPMAGPAFIITFVYGFSLYWNETFLLSTYLNGKFETIPMLLGNLEQSYNQMIGTGGDPSRMADLNFTEAKAFAGTLMSITPLILLYGVVQRWFVESIDKSGITGE